MRDDEEATVIDFVMAVGFVLIWPLMYLAAFCQHGWPGGE